MVEIHLTLRLRASPRVHDGAETPSTITLKQASTIAEMRTSGFALIDFMFQQSL